MKNMMIVSKEVKEEAINITILAEFMILTIRVMDLRQVGFKKELTMF